MKTENIAVVILAAGQSTRFGSAKMNHSLGNGKTILSTCVEKYQSVFTNVNVVVGNDDKTHQTVTDLDANVVVANHSNQGMSQSLIAGIQSQTHADAWLIALGDMPYVTSETLMTLAVHATASNIVAPLCGDRRGNPIIFGRSFQNQLMLLQGDVGAKQVLNANPSLVLEVVVKDTGVLHDVDRPGDVL